MLSKYEIIDDQHLLRKEADEHRFDISGDNIRRVHFV